MITASRSATTISNKMYEVSPSMSNRDHYLKLTNLSSPASSRNSAADAKITLEALKKGDRRKSELIVN